MIDYQQRGDLAKDVAFRDRVKIANLTYADYITNEAASVPAHNTRLAWAQKAVAQPDAVAQQVQQLVVNDAKVIEAGKDITDTDLQAAVETTVNKWM